MHIHIHIQIFYTLYIHTRTPRYIFHVHGHKCIAIIAWSMKRSCCHFDKIFIIGCTESCQNDNFESSRWRKFHQNDNIPVSVTTRCNYHGHSHSIHYADMLSLYGNKSSCEQAILNHVVLNFSKELTVHTIPLKNDIHRYLQQVVTQKSQSWSHGNPRFSAWLTLPWTFYITWLCPELIKLIIIDAT